MEDATDVELVTRLGSDDPGVRRSAFSELFRRHHRRAYDLAYRVLGDAALAADAVQEAFLTVYRKGARFEARARFTSWLHRVVVNQSIDLRRRERRHRSAAPPSEALAGVESGDPAGSFDVRDPASEATGPLAGALSAERVELVRRAVARLSPKLARVVVLRYPEGRSYEEIGEILGVPPGTVKSRLNRAHAALREILGTALDEEDSGPPA